MKRGFRRQGFRSSNLRDVDIQKKSLFSEMNVALFSWETPGGLWPSFSHAARGCRLVFRADVITLGGPWFQFAGGGDISLCGVCMFCLCPCGSSAVQRHALGGITRFDLGLIAMKKGNY